MSHLVSAEQLHSPVNAKQLTTFREIASLFSGVPASLANSSGIFLGPQFQFDLVRPGAALYGVNPTPEADNPMQPVVELKARIVQIRNIDRGETRRLRRHLDRAAADAARDRRRRLCRRLFPRRQLQ